MNYHPPEHYWLPNLHNIRPPKDGFDVSVLEILGPVDSFVNGLVEYEVFARPNFDWDTAAATIS